MRLLVHDRQKNGLPDGEIGFTKAAEIGKVLYCNNISLVKRKPPTTLSPITKKFLQMLQTPEQKEFVISGKGWKVWGNQGAVITNNNKLFRDVSREFNDKTHSIFNQFRIIDPTPIDQRIAVLAASGGSVYYHWMFDIITRIGLLEKSDIFSTIDKFVLDYIPNNYQTETLLRAGLDLSRIIPSNNHWNFHIEAKEIIVTSLTTPNDCPSLDSCLYLRRLYEQEIKAARPNKYLYIQRLDNRKIVNEADLLNYLATLNYQVVNPEKHTISEQAAIFAGADVIIGPHGAGFTNIVFCKPGTIVIDLFSPEWINPCYWVISEHLDLNYGYLTGERLRQKETYKRANILIDINKLKVLLKKMEGRD